MKKKTVGKKSKSTSKSSVSIHKKPVSTRKAPSRLRQRFQQVPPAIRKTLNICIIACVVIVAFCLALYAYNEPSKVAARKIDELGRDYYENYYYPKLVESLENNVSIEDTLAKYSEDGFSPVLLRHLLLFDNGKDADYSRFFDSSKYNCDKNISSIKITPVAPYGKKDYKIESSLTCNYK